MSHKTHPKILRMKRNEDWLSRGFYRKNFPQYLEEDFKIRTFLKKKLPQGTIENVEIERGAIVLKIFIKTARPALIIGRGGEGVKKLNKEIEKLIDKKDIKIEILTVRSPWASASLASQWIASQIEKRVPYRRVLKMALSKIMSSKEVIGARVEVSGRLNGIAISRTEWLQEGELPRQKLRNVFDYAFSKALCSYGVIGVKVWMNKGEEFE